MSSLFLDLLYFHTQRHQTPTLELVDDLLLDAAAVRKQAIYSRRVMAESQELLRTLASSPPPFSARD